MSEIQYLKLICPSCQGRLRARPEARGKRAKCKGCGAKVEVPAVEVPVAEDPTAVDPTLEEQQVEESLFADVIEIIEPVAKLDALAPPEYDEEESDDNTVRPSLHERKRGDLDFDDDRGKRRSRRLDTKPRKKNGPLLLIIAVAGFLFLAAAVIAIYLILESME